MEPAVGAQTPAGGGPAPSAAAPPKPSASHVGLQVLGSVGGSLTGAVVTDIAGTSQAATLLAATLGAALPALITLIGPFRFRLGLSLLVIAAGLAITYVGYTVWQNGWRHTTFPSPLAKSGPAPGDVAFDGPLACSVGASSAVIAFTVAAPVGTVPVLTSLADSIVEVPTGRRTGVTVGQPLPAGTRVTVTLDPGHRLVDADRTDNVATVTCPSS